MCGCRGRSSAALHPNPAPLVLSTASAMTLRNLVRRTLLAPPCVLLLIAGIASAQTNITGNVYDGNGGPLLAGQVYHVTGVVTVPAAETLTAQPGAIIKFNSSTRFSVLGTLLVQGTAGSEVVFTSILDDSAGGDTNGDGASSGSPGAWQGLHLQSSSVGTALDHAVIRYSGQSSYSAIENNALDLILRDSLIEESSDHAINFNSKNGPFVIERNTLRNCLGRALDGVHIETLAGFLDNVASGNAMGDSLRLSNSTLNKDLTIGPRNGLGNVVLSSAVATVGSGQTLELSAGLIWKFDSTSTRFNVVGTLRSLGTAIDPVIITTANDDEFGGDTHNDGMTTGTPGSWQGVHLLSSSTGSLIEHTLIRFPGSGSYSGVQNNAADLTLRDTTIEFSSDHAVDMNSQGGSFSIERCVLRDSAGYAVDGVRLDELPSFLDNAASGNTKGDIIHVSQGVMSADLTISLRNLIGATVMTPAIVTVPVGTTLTLDPGVIWKWENTGTRFNASGALAFQGTPTQPIVLTVVADDEFGGDTPKDGPTVGAPGGWQGIHLQGTSTGTHIEHTLVRYSGAASYSGIQNNANDFILRNSILEHGTDNALDMTNANGTFVIENNHFRDCARYAVDNVHIETLPGFAQNRASGNGLGNYQRVTTGLVSQDTTIERRNLLGGQFVLTALLVPSAGQTITIRDGVIIKLVGTLRLDGSGSFRFLGNGRSPVVVTTLADDAYGGDTNLDGPSSGTPGSWHGAYLNSCANVQWEHVLLRYGGSGGYPGRSMDPNSGAGETAVINAVRVEHCSTTGFRLDSLTAPATNLIAFQNGGTGIELRGGTFDLVHATSVGNGLYGIDETAATTGFVQNSISWGNGSANYDGLVLADVHDSNGDPGFAGSNGNLSVDPLFVDESGGDLGLTATSLCIDAANRPVAETVILDHVENSRLLDPTLSGDLKADMGALEYSLWTVEVTGVPRVGGRLRHTVNGPAGSVLLYFGLLDGATLVDPYGFLAAGSASLTLLDSGDVGVPILVDIPRSSALIGVEVGLQGQVGVLGGPVVGGTTQLIRVVLAPLRHIDRQSSSL